MSKLRNLVRSISRGEFSLIAQALSHKLGLIASPVDEVDIVAECLPETDGVLVDVGAHFGNVSKMFARKGWRVVAFEPDPENRGRLAENVEGFGRVQIDERALSNQPADSVTFYKSQVSTGISGLSAFHESHVAATTVAVTTLAQIIEQYNLTSIDFLKIDTEGFDKFVLDALPWGTHAPRAIVCEFEDAKTLPLGYSFTDLAQMLVDLGYSVIVSEWKPIVRYGAQHEWLAFKRFPAVLEDEKGWGNLIASRDPELTQRLLQRCKV